jgi:HAMP domain-containing protein
LLAGGEVLAGTLPGSSTTSTLNRFVEDCGDIAECELEIDGEQYLSLEIGREGLGEGIRLVSFQSLDQASKSFTDSVAGVFPVVGGGGLVLALVFAFVGSRTIAKPVVRLASALSRASDEGGFPEEIPAEYQAAEVNILAKEFSRAAVAVRDSERRLDEATEEFIESMSQAQDARDPYTAGHSERVSESSVAMARVLGVPEGEIDVIRIGAKMHDLGKIGIPDAVLRKPGRLTPEEYELIQRHPIIGKEILEKVGRFDPFLPIVELHHENPDGSGYPYGLRGRDIPLAVRIVHVADVYDAITSDRAYRSAMADEDAWDLLLRGTGTLFDPRAVEALWSVVGKGRFRPRESVAVGTHENDAAFYSLPFAGAQG